MSVVRFGPELDRYEEDALPEEKIRNVFPRNTTHTLTTEYEKSLRGEILRYVTCPIGTIFSHEEGKCMETSTLVEDPAKAQTDLLNIGTQYHMARDSAFELERRVHYAENDAVLDMRTKLGAYREHYIAGTAADYVGARDSGNGSACKLIWSHTGDTLNHRTHMFEWQQLAFQHITAVCSSDGKKKCVLVYHDTGSGKSTILSTSLKALLNPRDKNNERRYKPKEGESDWVPWLLVPGLSATGEAPFFKFVKDISKLLPEFTPDVVDRTELDAAIANARVKSTALKDAVGEARKQALDDAIEAQKMKDAAAKAHADAEEEALLSGLQTHMEKATKFGNRGNSPNAFWVEDQVLQYNPEKLNSEVFGKETLPNRLGQKRIADRLKTLANATGVSKASHVIFIDESQNFVNSEKAFAIIKTFVDLLEKNTKTDKIRVIFFSGTPASTDKTCARYTELFEQTNFTVSYLGSLPASLKTYSGEHEKITHPDYGSLVSMERAGRLFRKLPWSSEKQYLYRWHERSIQPDIKSMDSAFWNIQRALRHFAKYAGTEYARCKRHVKCIIVVPDKYVDKDGKTAEKDEPGSEQVYQILKSVLQTRTPYSFFDAGETKTFYEVDTAEPQTVAADFGYAFYDTVYAQGHGGGVFGETEDLPNMSHQEVKDAMGVGKKKPLVQILFINDSAVGKSYVGVSRVYFAHNAVDSDMEYQLQNRGIRLCSSFEFPEDDYTTRIVYVGCDPLPPKSKTIFKFFKNYIVDQGANPEYGKEETATMNPYEATNRKIMSTHNMGSGNEEETVACLDLVTYDEVRDVFNVRDKSGENYLRFLCRSYSRECFGLTQPHPLRFKAFCAFISGRAPSDNTRYPVKFNVAFGAANEFIKKYDREYSKQVSETIDYEYIVHDRARKIVMPLSVFLVEQDVWEYEQKLRDPPIRHFNTEGVELVYFPESDEANKIKMLDAMEKMNIYFDPSPPPSTTQFELYKPRPPPTFAYLKYEMDKSSNPDLKLEKTSTEFRRMSYKMSPEFIQSVRETDRSNTLAENILDWVSGWAFETKASYFLENICLDETRIAESPSIHFQLLVNASLRRTTSGMGQRLLGKMNLKTSGSTLANRLSEMLGSSSDERKAESAALRLVNIALYKEVITLIKGLEQYRDYLEKKYMFTTQNCKDLVARDYAFTRENAGKYVVYYVERTGKDTDCTVEMSRTILESLANPNTKTRFVRKYTGTDERVDDVKIIDDPLEDIDMPDIEDPQNDQPDTQDPQTDQPDTEDPPTDQPDTEDPQKDEHVTSRKKGKAPMAAQEAKRLKKSKSKEPGFRVEPSGASRRQTRSMKNLPSLDSLDVR